MTDDAHTWSGWDSCQDWPGTASGQTGITYSLPVLKQFGESLGSLISVDQSPANRRAAHPRGKRSHQIHGTGYGTEQPSCTQGI